MKKITLLLLILASSKGFTQSKSTGTFSLTSNMTANFTLDNATSKVTLILTGPSDRWFALGLGVESGFSMSEGDVIVYTTSLNDRNYIGTTTPANDASQDWTTVSNIVNGSGVRTLTLQRNLTNSDPFDFQLPYATTNSINVAWARSATSTTTLGNHGTVNRSFATGTFTTLGIEDFSLNATSIFPNPSSGEFSIKTKTNLSKVNVYNQTGTLVKTIELTDLSNQVNVNISGLQSGVYILELLNNSDKSWKKIIIN